MFMTQLAENARRLRVPSLLFKLHFKMPLRTVNHVHYVTLSLARVIVLNSEILDYSPQIYIKAFVSFSKICYII